VENSDVLGCNVGSCGFPDFEGTGSVEVQNRVSTGSVQGQYRVSIG